MTTRAFGPRRLIGYILLGSIMLMMGGYCLGALARTYWLIALPAFMLIGIILIMNRDWHRNLSRYISRIGF